MKEWSNSGRADSPTCSEAEGSAEQKKMKNDENKIYVKVILEA